MMNGKPTTFFKIIAPEPMKIALSEFGLEDLQLHISDVAICLSMVARLSELSKDAAKKIMIAAASLRHSALQTKLDLPVVVIIDISGGDKSEDLRFRKSFNDWATDQDWHRGDFAMYVCPPVSPYRDESADWTKPRNREELVRHLLGTGPDDWEIPTVDRPTVKTVSEEIERYIDETPETKSGVRGELLTSLVGALRDIDRLQQSRAEKDDSGKSVAEIIVDRALLDWEERNLASPDKTRDAMEADHD